MSEAPRKPLKLAIEPQEPVEEKPWQVRTADGQVRGPIGTEQLRALAEIGLVDEASAIAAAGTDDWRPLGEHALWPEVRVKPTAPKLKGDQAVKGSGPDASTVNQDVTPAMQARLDEMHARETHRVWVGFMYWRAIGAVRAVREVLVFFSFIVLGDLLVSFIDSNLALVRWVVLMGLIAVALGYYVLRALEK